MTVDEATAEMARYIREHKGCRLRDAVQHLWETLLREMAPVPVKRESGASGKVGHSTESYLMAHAAIMNGEPRDEVLKREFGTLALQERYLSRISKALDLAFEDFDREYIMMDLETLSRQERAKLFRGYYAIQYCQLLTALVGPDQMRALVTNAMQVAMEETQ